MFPKMVGNIFRAIFTLAFAVVGCLVGAITGALIGLTTESGLFRGAGIGAISGAIVSIEAIESSFALWQSGGLEIWSISYMIETIPSLLGGGLVQEKVDLAVQSAVQSQLTAMDFTLFESLDISETCDAKGMPMDSIHKLPKIVITSESYVNASGESISCAVCLQDFQIGELARRLPHCHHKFHLPCVDGWLLMRGSCPLCRRDY